MCIKHNLFVLILYTVFGPYGSVYDNDSFGVEIYHMFLFKISLITVWMGVMTSEVY